MFFFRLKTDAKRLFRGAIRPSFVYGPRAYLHKSRTNNTPQIPVCCRRIDSIYNTLLHVSSDTKINPQVQREQWSNNIVYIIKSAHRLDPCWLLHMMVIMMQSKSVVRPLENRFFPSFCLFPGLRWRWWRRRRRRHHIAHCFTANKKLMMNRFRSRRKQRRRVFPLRRQNAGDDDDNQLTVVAALPVTTGRPERFFWNERGKKGTERDTSTVTEPEKGKNE